MQCDHAKNWIIMVASGRQCALCLKRRARATLLALACAYGSFKLSVKTSKQSCLQRKMTQEAMTCFVNVSASVTMGTPVCQSLPTHPCGYAGRELGEAIELTRSCQILLLTLYVPGQKQQDKLPHRETHWGILLPFLKDCDDGWCYKQRMFWLILAELWQETSPVCSCIKPLFSFCRLPRREESWIYYQLTWRSDYGHGTGY